MVGQNPGADCASVPRSVVGIRLPISDYRADAGLLTWRRAGC